MTTTVTIRTRAWGASVLIKTAVEGDQGHNVEETSFEVQPQSTADLQVSGKATIEVIEKPPEAEQAETVENERPFAGEPVPGAAENDELIKPIGGKRPIRESAPVES